MKSSVAPASSVHEVLALYDRWGADPYDEVVSQNAHAAQSAALACAAGADDALIAAALLHDVGHLLALAALENKGAMRHRGSLPDTDLEHETIGARYLSGVFGPQVTAPIALHVRAKRFRCATDPEYVASLSPGSIRSLELQGGPADADEVAGFEANPASADAIRLRGWDDAAKVDDLDVADVSTYEALLERVAGRTRLAVSRARRP